MKIQGNITALITPMKKNFEVDFSTLSELVEYQIAGGTNGIVALGSTGEAAMLNEEEKHNVFKFICDNVAKRVCVIAGINAFSLDEALSMAQKRIEEGADALLISPPPYIKPSDEGIKKYFMELAKFSKVPIILYNIPSRTGANISLETIKELSEEENIIGIKEASGDIAFAEKVSRLCGDNFSLICGNDNLILPYLALGSRCCISVVGNAMPSLMNEIIKNFSSNAQRSREIFLRYSNLLDLLSKANPSMIKWVLNQLDLSESYIRKPLLEPNIKLKKLTKEVLDELNND